MLLFKCKSSPIFFLRPSLTTSVIHLSLEFPLHLLSLLVIFYCLKLCKDSFSRKLIHFFFNQGKFSLHLMTKDGWQFLKSQLMSETLSWFQVYALKSLVTQSVIHRRAASASPGVRNVESQAPSRPTKSESAC